MNRSDTAALLSRTALVICVVGMAGSAHAQIAAEAGVPPTTRMTTPGSPPNTAASPDSRPAFSILRQDEDWSSLADPTRRTDPLDTLKYVSLNEDGSIWLSTAVDSYVSYRDFENEGFGTLRGPDGTFNTRLNLHASINFADRFRVYGALKHGDSYDRSSPVAPPNRDRLDLHQAFVELNFGDAFDRAPSDALVRVGRQEIHYGAGRLISARLGPNVRSDYDGVLVRARVDGIVTDAFAFRGVTDKPEVFDNGSDRSESLWGVYSSIPAERFNIDLMYVGQERERSAYVASPSPFQETRHTVGARIWRGGPPGGWKVDLEAHYQFGDARPVSGPDLAIETWTLSGSLTWSAPKARLAPAAGIEFGFTSGDGDPVDGTLGTYRAVAPPGRYFGEANSFGPGNLAGFRPYFEFRPVPALRIRPKATFFWRMDLDDGTYTLAPTVLRPARGSSRYAGVEPGLEADYRFNAHWTLSAFLARFIAGDYLRDNPPGRDITYVEATLSFKL